jgi:hypothetical protein
MAIQHLTLLIFLTFSSESMKAGTCPFRKPVKCFRYKKPQCKNDWQCPEKRKCCPDYCGIKCLDPVPISNPGKPVEELGGEEKASRPSVWGDRLDEEIFPSLLLSMSYGAQCVS